jgi:hypothetical protein
MAVIKSIVQQKNPPHIQSQSEELPPKLCKGVRTKPSPDQAAQMLSTEIHFDRPRRM